MKNETIRIGQTTIDFLLEASDTNGSVAMFEFGVPTGARVPPPHYQADLSDDRPRSCSVQNRVQRQHTLCPIRTR